MSVNDILQLSKIRLTTSVVFSAIAGYFIAGGMFQSLDLIALVLGGFFVVAASNGFNQVLEKDLDKLMKRTENRPLPKQRMTTQQALIFSISMGLVGVVLLFTINMYCGIFGSLSILLYVLAYTPLKRISSFSVFVGAFPGAIPFMLGWVAVSNDFAIEAGILFAIQFIWQFPHFWAIAWVTHEDYKKAGYHLLPSASGKSKQSAFQILLYSLALIPFSLIPWILDWTGNTTFVIAAILGTLFFIYAYKLFLSQEDADARKLMFASFVYLPIIQFTYVLDKAEHIKILSDGFI